MALSGSVSTPASHNRSVTLEWTATQSISDNMSTLSWQVVGSGTHDGYVVVGEIKVTIDGSVVFYRSADTTTRCYIGTVLASGTFNIYHSADGSRAFGASIEAGIYEHSINCTNGDSFGLDTIPRASTISAGAFTLGVAGTITVSKASSTFTHTITYIWGNTTYSTSGTICVKSSNTSISWTPPLEFARSLPSAMRGNGALVCKTYNGDTEVGSKSITFTCNVPSSLSPEISNLSITPESDANLNAQNWDVSLAGYTKVRLQATATGLYGATITSFVVAGSYNTTQSGSSLNYLGSTLQTSGTHTFIVHAIDSRGQESTYVMGSISVLPYARPAISMFSVERNSSDSTGMVVSAGWTFDSVNGNNTATITLQYKRHSDTTWTNYTGTISNGTQTALSTIFEVASSYDFRLVVRDALSNSVTSTSFVSTLSVLLDFRAGGRGLGIGKIAESDSLEIALPTVFMSQIYIQDSGGNRVTLENYIRSLM